MSKSVVCINFFFSSTYIQKAVDLVFKLIYHKGKQLKITGNHGNATSFLKVLIYVSVILYNTEEYRKASYCYTSLEWKSGNSLMEYVRGRLCYECGFERAGAH